MRRGDGRDGTDRFTAIYSRFRPVKENVFVCIRNGHIDSNPHINQRREIWRGLRLLINPSPAQRLEADHIHILFSERVVGSLPWSIARSVALLTQDGGYIRETKETMGCLETGTKIYEASTESNYA